MFDKQVIKLLKKHNLTSRVLLAPRDSDLTLIYPNQDKSNNTKIVISFLKFNPEKSYIQLWNHSDNYWMPTNYKNINALFDSIEKQNGGNMVFPIKTKNLIEALHNDFGIKNNTLHKKYRYWVVLNQGHHVAKKTNHLVLAWFMYQFKYKKSAVVWDTQGWVDNSISKPWLKTGHPTVE